MSTLAHHPSTEAALAPSRQELADVFALKFGPLETTGWIPRRCLSATGGTT